MRTGCGRTPGRDPGRFDELLLFLLFAVSLALLWIAPDRADGAQGAADDGAHGKRRAADDAAGPAGPGEPAGPDDAEPAEDAPAPAPTVAVGESIPLERAAIETELEQVAAALEKAADETEIDRLEAERRVLRHALDAIERRAELARRRAALEDRRAAAARALERLADQVGEPFEPPEPLTPEAVEAARAEEARLRTALADLDATLEQTRAAPAGIRVAMDRREKELRQRRAELEELIARERAAENDEDRAALQRRISIARLDAAQVRKRIDYLRDYLELAREDLPVRQEEREVLAQKLGRASLLLETYLRIEERRVADQRREAERSARERRAEAAASADQPAFARLLAETEADVAAALAENARLRERANAWSQRRRELRERTGHLLERASAIAARLHDDEGAGRPATVRTAVTIRRLGEALDEIERLRRSLLLPAAADAQDDLDDLRIRRARLVERRRLASRSLRTRRAEAKASFEQNAPREASWSEMEGRWGRLESRWTELLTRRQALVDGLLDQLVEVEELVARHSERLQRLRSELRAHAFWLREQGLLSAANARPAWQALTRWANGLEVSFRDGSLVEDAVASLRDPWRAGRLALLLGVGIALLALVRRGPLRAITARIDAELERPIPVRYRLRHAAWRLARAATGGTAWLAVAALAALLFDAPVLDVVLAGAALVLAYRVVAEVLHAGLGQHVDLRVLPVADDIGRLIDRVGRRFAALGVAVVLGHLAPPALLSAEAAAPLVDAVDGVARLVVILITLSFVASPAVLGRALGLISRDLARHLRWPLLATEAFVLCTVFAIFALDVLGYHIASTLVTTALVMSLLVLAAAAVLDRILYRVVLQRLAVEDEPPTVEGDGPGGGGASEEERDSPAAERRARQRWLRDAVATMVGLAVVAGVLYLIIFVAFAVEPTTLDAVARYPLLHLDEAAGTAIRVADLAVALLIVGGTLLIKRYLIGFLEHYVLGRVGLSAGARFAITRVIGYALVACGALIALRQMGIDLGRLEWFLAAAGVGIGFGLQEILSNFVSGLIILVERPIETGDIVTIDQVEGTVEKITIRSTTVRTLENISKIIPNKQFITSTVTNWSHGDPLVMLRLEVGVAYGSDLATVRRTLLRVAEAYDGIVKRPRPAVRFTGFGPSSLDFLLSVWVPTPDPRRRYRTISDLNLAIDEAFRSEGITVPFQQVDLHVKDAPAALDVASRRGRRDASGPARMRAPGATDSGRDDAAIDEANEAVAEASRRGREEELEATAPAGRSKAESGSGMRRKRNEPRSGEE